MTGQQIYELGLTRIGCKYKLGALVPKDDANYLKEFDCAELASWLVFQIGGILYGCDTSDIARARTADAYTGFWARDAKVKGIIIPVDQAIGIKGAFLLRIAGDGTIGHIVCVDGKGGTVEAHSTAKGVGKFSTNNRRFDIGILLPDFIYDKPNLNYASEKPKGIVYRFTTPLMPKSDVVKRIQTALIANGFSIGKSGVDGQFGLSTMNAVFDFQKKHGLTPDGEVYTETAKELKINL